MTLCVLGRMDDQPQLCRRQLPAANRTRLDERFLVSGAELVDGTIDLIMESTNEILDGDVRA